MPISTISQAGLDAPISLTSPTLTTPNINSAQVATVSGTAPLYLCRAWVNFNGTGTPAIRASGNVSSLTDNGVGDYTVNFTTAMPDTNYICTGTSGVSNTAIQVVCPNFDVAAPTTSAMRIQIVNPSNVQDRPYNHIAVFR
jgi:hypothetical protein